MLYIYKYIYQYIRGSTKPKNIYFYQMMASSFKALVESEPEPNNFLIKN